MEVKLVTLRMALVDKLLTLRMAMVDKLSMSYLSRVNTRE